MLPHFRWKYVPKPAWLGRLVIKSRIWGGFWSLLFHLMCVTWASVVRTGLHPCFIREGGTDPNSLVGLSGGLSPPAVSMHKPAWQWRGVCSDSHQLDSWLILQSGSRLPLSVWSFVPFQNMLTVTKLGHVLGTARTHLLKGRCDFSWENALVIVSRPWGGLWSGKSLFILWYKYGRNPFVPKWMQTNPWKCLPRWVAKSWEGKGMLSWPENARPLTWHLGHLGTAHDDPGIVPELRYLCDLVTLGPPYVQSVVSDTVWVLSQTKDPLLFPCMY